MSNKFLPDDWDAFDPHEIRILLDKHIGGPGQYSDRETNPSTLHLPLAGTECRVSLKFRDDRIIDISPGSAFDDVEWDKIKKEISSTISSGPQKIGREYSFSTFRVSGSWRGERSGVQIIPPPDDAPSAKFEIADHPFILEFPVKESSSPQITNYRRIRTHRSLTLLLNVLLLGRFSFLPSRSRHVWASVRQDDDSSEIKWVQEFYFAKLGQAIAGQLSECSSENLIEIDAVGYYKLAGHDGLGLRVPDDLDDSICQYFALTIKNRQMFDRAMFWMNMASRQWTDSTSASFASLVSCVEALTPRGKAHSFKCPVCGEGMNHEVPGAVRRFKDFFEAYAPDGSLAKRRAEMYSLRSSVLHGSELLQDDLGTAFGWDPPSWNQRELVAELWSLTRLATRNWLKSQ